MLAERPAPPGGDSPATMSRSIGTPNLPAQTSSTPGWCMSIPSPASTRRRGSAARRIRPPTAAIPGRDPGGTPRPRDRRWPAAAKRVPATRPVRPCGEVRSGPEVARPMGAVGRAGSPPAGRSRSCPEASSRPANPGHRLPQPAPAEAGIQTRRARSGEPGHPSDRWMPHPVRRCPSCRTVPASRPSTRTGRCMNGNAGGIRGPGPVWRQARGMDPGSTPRWRSGGRLARFGSPTGTPRRCRGPSRRYRCRGRLRGKLQPEKETGACLRRTSRTCHQRRTLAGRASSLSPSGRAPITSIEEMTLSPTSVWPGTMLRRPVRRRPAATRRPPRRRRGIGSGRTVAARTPPPRSPWTLGRRNRPAASTTWSRAASIRLADTVPAWRRKPPPGRQEKSRPHPRGRRRPSRLRADRRPARVAPLLEHTRTWRLLASRTLPLQAQRREVVEW